MSAPRAPVPHRSQRVYRFREFLHRLAEKCDDDEISFMAGAIAFNMVIALFPLLVLAVGITGYLLSRFGDPTGVMVELLTRSFPQGGGADPGALASILTEGLVERRASFTIAGGLFFIWLATRLSTSVRVALRETFDIAAKRNPLLGKLFDVVAVVIGVLLLVVNIGATVFTSAALELGENVLGMGGSTFGFAEWLAGFTISFASIWTLLFLAYRYMPARPIPLRTAVVAATFAAVGHESLKSAFSWYVIQIASYDTTFGNLATLAVFVFWIYYEALVFILGGEIAQVSMMRRASRVGVVSFEKRS